ncbi:MAG TPA: Wzz/FepE/Etk N-terminal domain-containing protein [Sedimentibacter sp.]|nr:hypothetical protein [Sedimentibacter sp.]HOA19593.1 Wzz/FepE/Etk N-terminal domain-containing protein [Sedimentibacter sp.]
MNKNEKEVQYYVYQTDLKEIFLVLWKRKKMIISLSLIVGLIVALYSKFVIIPTYETKLNIIISMPETYTTRYGEYELPFFDNSQYLNLIKSNDVIANTIKYMDYDNDVSIEDLRGKVTILETKAASGVKQNSFEIIVSERTPEESLKLAQNLYKSYLDFIDVMIKEVAINNYYNEFTLQNKNLEKQLNSNKEILKRNEELLNEIPKSLSQEGSSIDIKRSLNESIDYVIPINAINPNYISIESDIIQNKQSINEIENHIRMNNMFLTELEEELQSVKEYYETGKVKKLESNIVSSVTANIYLPSPPVAPTFKSSPSIALNTAIGLSIGLFIGVLITLIKEYWLDVNKK